MYILLDLNVLFCNIFKNAFSAIKLPILGRMASILHPLLPVIPSFPVITCELVFSFLCFVCSLYFTVFCQKHSSNRKNKNVPLPDILHTDNLDFSPYYKLTGVPINLYTFLLIFYFNKHIEKFLYMLTFMYTIRAISFSLTILPKCGKMNDKDNTRSCSQILFDYVTMRDPHIGHNNDLLFSGHVGFVCLFNLYVYHFGYVGYETNAFMWFINFINSIFIILTRCHYSIDVLYSYIVTYLIYDKCCVFLF